MARNTPEVPSLDELLVSMGMERYADNIRRTLAAAPPLTDEQRRILREAMHGRPTASGTS